MPSYTEEYDPAEEEAPMVETSMVETPTTSKFVKMSFVAAAALAVSSIGYVATKGSSGSPSGAPAMAPQMATAPKHASGKPVNPDEWKEREDVKAMQALKVVYGDMDKEEVWNMFKKFQTDFNRDYASVSETEEDERFIMFKKNLVTIDSLNRQNPLAKFGITEAADRTEEEKAKRKMSPKFADYQTMLDSLPQDMVEAALKGPEHVMGKTFNMKTRSADTPDKHDGAVDVDDGAISIGQVEWADEKMCAACERFPGFKDYTSDNRPTDFDWRDLGAVTSVKNQKYCGSCWTFSTAADLEGSHYLAGYDLVSLSEQQIVACDTNMYGCDGGYMYAAMQYVEEIGGLVSYDDYPYKGVLMDYELGTPTCDTDLINEVLEDNDKEKFGHSEGFQFVAMGPSYEDLMATVMLKNGPLSIGINANGMDYYEFGITGCETIAGTEYCEAGSISTSTPCDPTYLDHGVLAVGYGVQNGTAYWVIKNSWGDSWGEDGYYRLERGSDHCGVSNMVQHTVYKKSDYSNKHTPQPTGPTVAPTSQPSVSCGKGCDSDDMMDDMFSGGGKSGSGDAAAPSALRRSAKQGAFRK